MNQKRKVADVAKAYDAWADIYDTDGNPLVALDDFVASSALFEIDVVMTVAFRGKRVLDLGCGTGRHTARFLAGGAQHVVGLDGSAGMLAKARAKLAASDRVSFVEHRDLANLPFDDASFDFIMCALVLEHVEHLDASFREMARVTKAPSMIYVSDIHIHARMREKTQANFTDPATGDDVLPPSYPHEAEDYANAAASAGFIVAGVNEVEGFAELVERVPRMAKYVGTPMLVYLAAAKPAASTLERKPDA